METQCWVWQMLGSCIRDGSGVRSRKSLSMTGKTFPPPSIDCTDTLHGQTQREGSPRWRGRRKWGLEKVDPTCLQVIQSESVFVNVQEAEEAESPQRSIRDSGYIDCWDSERSDSLSPPRHGREDSFDSLDSFGSRSRQTPSPDVLVTRGSSDGRKLIFTLFVPFGIDYGSLIWWHTEGVQVRSVTSSLCYCSHSNVSWGKEGIQYWLRSVIIYWWMM